jgi:hexosaminidase
MNRFHLHVTDSQSWPLVIPALPNLSAKGAYRPDLVYTPDDFAEIQHYAAIRGVEMITEIDMPGHTSSIHYSYPLLIAAFNKQPDWDTYAAEPPSGTLKLNSSAVYDFLETLFADLLPRVSPYSSYFHTGGDEVNKNAYTLDDTVKSNDSAILQPLMQKFVDRNHNQVRAAGLTPVVWEEMLLDWNLTLGPDVIVQSWQSDEAVASIVAKGHKALVGNYNYWVRTSNFPLMHGVYNFLAHACVMELTRCIAVPRLRQRPMAQLRPLRIRNILAVQRLLRPLPQLAPHLLIRSALWRAHRQTAPSSRRRSAHVG